MDTRTIETRNINISPRKELCSLSSVLAPDARVNFLIYDAFFECLISHSSVISMFTEFFAEME